MSFTFLYSFCAHMKMNEAPIFYLYPLGTQRCCDVESTSVTLIQRRNNVVCPVGDLLVSNVYSWSNKVLQLSHNIVSICSAV